MVGINILVHDFFTDRVDFDCLRAPGKDDPPDNNDNICGPPMWMAIVLNCLAVLGTLILGWLFFGSIIRPQSGRKLAPGLIKVDKNPVGKSVA